MSIPEWLDYCPHGLSIGNGKRHGLAHPLTVHRKITLRNIFQVNSQ